MKSVVAIAIALAIPAVSAAPTEHLTKPFPRQDDGLDIVGGSAATLGEFPYIVSLSEGGSHFCGGVLLNANTVLTAAHCSVGQTASSVKVRAGSITYGSGGKQVGVSTILVNPSYSSSTTNNDVALWRLSTAIATSSTIAYATLPAQGNDPAAGLSTIVAGWGLTSESGSTLPTSLRKVTVPVITRASCRSQYGTSAITDNMWCAGFAAGGKDSCSGDSGGPIVDASTKVLLGLVSWGQGCARANYAGVYARVGNYVTWINSNKW